MTLTDHCFTPFQEDISEYTLPERFTFPFYYTPHPLALLAAKELQDYLENQKEWTHNFWLTKNGEYYVGKMFGVLIVQNKNNQIGYLSAYSGKLSNNRNLTNFVPPVYDVLANDGIFSEDINRLNLINRKIETLEVAPDYLDSLAELEKTKTLASLRLNEIKVKSKEAKKARKIRREKEKALLPDEAFKRLLATLAKESSMFAYHLKGLSNYWKARIANRQEKVNYFQNTINQLKEKRKNKSAELQKEMFDQYQFLNHAGKVKKLTDIFQQNIPASGAGDCAAPKLLQYAFQHQMKPIALAEFWWGQSPSSEIRKHKQFYPACIGKCKPILSHMLDGILMDENPMLTNPAEGKVIEIIYEDNHLLVINKPAEFLSVPGRNIKDSVAKRMKEKFPNATGPLVVHRLDMSTSGLMLIAKSLETHKYLQYQFIKRTIKKRYVALLDGIVAEEEGIIDLPLHNDWDNRPRQKVCYKEGKSARTEWKVISRNNQQTRIHFHPITGRTHQLRVHAAHELGLNMPIIGDDLYGIKNERLCLHAEWIEFRHPVSKEIMSVEVEAEF